MHQEPPAKLQYKFQDSSLWRRAMTHGSKDPQNYERLEFLGDAVLGAIITSALYQRHEEAREGFLTEQRSTLVNGRVLAEIAEELELGPCLRLGMCERKNGGRYKVSILACALEAVIGAIYLDAGYDVCQEKVLLWFGDRLDGVRESLQSKDPKGVLQEYTQKLQLPLPKYSIEKIMGAEHEPVFWVTCEVSGQSIARAKGSSRRGAERLAATEIIKVLSGTIQ